MASTGTLYVVFRNAKAVAAFLAGIEAVNRAAEDEPWNEDLQEALGLLKFAALDLDVESERAICVMPSRN